MMRYHKKFHINILEIYSDIRVKKYIMKNQIFDFVPAYICKEKSFFAYLSYHLVENIVNI